MGSYRCAWVRSKVGRHPRAIAASCHERSVADDSSGCLRKPPAGHAKKRAQQSLKHCGLTEWPKGDEQLTRPKRAQSHPPATRGGTSSSSKGSARSIPRVAWLLRWFWTSVSPSVALSSPPELVIAPRLMPSKRTRETPPPAAAAAAATENPLRNRPLLEKAARDVAATIIRQRRTLTAMEFCIEVLTSLGLKEIAIGQSERIFLSSVRKLAFGAHDSELVLKPGPAGAVNLPTFEQVRDSLCTAAPSASFADEQKRCDRITASLSEHVQKRAAELRSRSIIHIKGFLETCEVQSIVSSLARNPRGTTFLRASSGTGSTGGYSEVDPRKCPILEAVRSALASSLRTALNPADALGSKVVVTRYGVGGVNWAHVDQGEGGYQAYLLLSRPKTDFTSGEFYITSPGAAEPTRQIEWSASGDLVVFAANAKEYAAEGQSPRNWLHGFREVKSGAAGVGASHLCVVGLLE